MQLCRLRQPKSSRQSAGQIQKMPERLAIAQQLFTPHTRYNSHITIKALIKNPVKGLGAP